MAAERDWEESGEPGRLLGDASDNSGTLVAGVDGPVSTGSGNLYYIGTAYLQGGDGQIRRIRPPRVVTGDHVQRLDQCFVKPGNFDQALSMLGRRSMVLLTGALGSGRHAAALMLLHLRDGDANGLVRNLSTEPEEEGHAALDPDSVETGEPLLLDLADVDPDRFLKIQDELGAFHAAVISRGARLVVVLSQDQDQLLANECRDLVVAIGRPDARTVLARHLSVEEVSFDPADLDEPGLASRLATSPMGELARLAWRVREARDAAKTRPGGSGRFAEWLAEATTALDQRELEVARAVRNNPDARYRVLLLSAGMLAGAPADAVFEADRALLDILRYPQDEKHEFDRSDFAERLETIEVKLDEARRIKFTARGYDAAVRNHFWDNFPSVRAQFREWVARCIRSRSLTGEDRDTLVVRFAEQCLRTDRSEDIFILSRGWTHRGDRNRPSGMAPLAAIALERGLRDEQMGWVFRQRLYDWSRQSRLAPDLAYVVIRLCVDVVAPDRPDPALVRLHYLSRHDDPGVAEAARQALLELARKPRFFRRLLYRLAELAADSSGRSVDQELFLRLVDPVRLLDAESRPRPLIGQAWVRARLVTGWHSVIAAQPHGLWAEWAYAWLAAHAYRSRNDHLLDVLVHATQGELKLLGALHRVCCDWLRLSDGSADRAARRTFQLIKRKIDEQIDRSAVRTPASGVEEK